MRCARLLSLAVGFLVLVWTGTAAAATIKVNTTQDDISPGDGQCSLRKAIEDVDSPGSSQTDCAPAAFGANTIVLDSMRYQLGVVPAVSELTIAPTVTNLTIEGAGEGLTTIDASGILDRAFDVSAGASVTITGVTISGGHAPDGASGTSGSAGQAGANGGAILNEGSLTLNDVAITNSRAGSGGAGGAGPANTGTNGGHGGPGGSGGGIYNTGALTLNGATLGSDSAGNGGSGGAGAAGTGTDGGSGGAGGAGGGIANVGGSLSVLDSTIRGDSAGSGGAGGIGGGGPPSGGGAGGAGGAGAAGGGVYTTGGTLSVTNATFASNSAGAGADGGGGATGVSNGGNGGAGGGGGSGGAVAASNPSTASLLNVTAAGNTPGEAGPGGAGAAPGGATGAVGAAGSTGGVTDQGVPTTLQSTLLALNGGGNCSGSVLDGGHDLSFGDSTCPATFSTGDPNLGALQDNGGPAPTISLGPGSAALDQIPATGAGCPATDERGVPRPSGSKCDIGAYEVAPPVASTGGASPSGATSMTLEGSVIANAGASDVMFEYGKTTRYGSTSRVITVGGVTPVQVSIMLARLKPHTTYHYRLVAMTMDGSSLGADRTFTTSLSPAISRLRIAPSTLRATAGATITYSDSRAARTAFVVLRCVKASGHRCTRYSSAERFTHRDTAGRNRVPFSSRGLRPGSYLLHATPRANGRSGPTVSAAFRIAG